MTLFNDVSNDLLIKNIIIKIINLINTLPICHRILDTRYYISVEQAKGEFCLSRSNI